MPKMPKPSAPPKNASLGTIAEELNISKSLVSKVLNNRMGTSGASKKMSAAIRWKAKELGYRKHRTAAALRNGRHGVLATLIHRHHAPDAGLGLADALVAGISAEACAQGQRLWLMFYETADEFRKLCPEAHASETDGLIVAGVGHEELAQELLDLEQTSCMPIVTIHNQPISDRLTNVGVDPTHLMRLGVEHLVQRGCKKIAHVSCMGPRLAGFEAALAACGQTADPGRISHVPDFSYAAGELGLLRLLDRGVEFDGVVAQSDLQALSAMHLLIKRGVDIPGQVKIVGIDDSPLCHHSIIPLTSVSQKLEERGREAVRLMLRRLSTSPSQLPGPMTSVNIDPVLRIRESS